MAAFLGLALVVSLLLHRRLAWQIALIVIIRVLVPVQAVGLYFPKIHPAYYLLTTMLFVELFGHTDRFAQAVKRSLPAVIGCVGLAAYAFLDVVGGYGALNADVGAIAQFLLLPVALFIMFRNVVANDPKAERALLWPVYGLVAFEVVLAQVQVDKHEPVFWDAAYKTSWWWTEEVTRGLGTTGHGLQLGVFMAIATPLLLRVPSIPFRMLSLPVLLYGTVLGQARLSFLLVLAAGSLVLLVSLFERPLASFLWSLVAVAIGVFYLSGRNELLADLLKKFEDDSGSTQKRTDALTWILGHYDQFKIFGYQGARDLRSSGVLGSSLENGYFMAALSFGLLFAALLFIYHLALILPSMLGGLAAWTYAVTAGSMIVMFNGSGSFMTGGLDGLLFFAVVAAGAGLARPDDAAESNPLDADAVDEAVDDADSAAGDAAELEPWQVAVRSGGWR